MPFILPSPPKQIYTKIRLANKPMERGSTEAGVIAKSRGLADSSLANVNFVFATHQESSIPFFFSKAGKTGR